jgi:hypothetical protein
MRECKREGKKTRLLDREQSGAEIVSTVPLTMLVRGIEDRSLLIWLFPFLLFGYAFPCACVFCAMLRCDQIVFLMRAK